MPYYRSKPAESFDDLLGIYATKDKRQIPVFNTLTGAKELIEEIAAKDRSDGFVISIEGSWGVGKTSFIKLLKDELNPSLNISNIYFDSLYYGNPSEATSILLDGVFEKLRNDFGILVKDDLQIAKNISPEFEVSNGIPKLTFRYKATRRSTESIISEIARDRLGAMAGKLMIVIDDIDRLPAGDVVHFLRLVRVLKELPNVIIILPIDRSNLERLIASQQVNKPKAYLQKIIDKSYSIDPEQSNARILFSRLLDRKYGSSKLNNIVINLLWNLLLWEISLVIIKQYEHGEGGRRLWDPRMRHGISWIL